MWAKKFVDGIDENYVDQNEPANGNVGLHNKEGIRIFIYPVVCYRQTQTSSLTVRPDGARWRFRDIIRSVWSQKTANFSFPGKPRPCFLNSLCL